MALLARYLHACLLTAARNFLFPHVFRIQLLLSLIVFPRLHFPLDLFENIFYTLVLCVILHLQCRTIQRSQVDLVGMSCFIWDKVP